MLTSLLVLGGSNSAVLGLAGYCFDERPSAPPLPHRLRKQDRDGSARRSSRVD